MTSSSSQLCLFGGDKPWSQNDWISSDDRVRGGSSISHLDCTPSSLIAVFNGNLDIKTLGGAGFASQRTTGEDKTWDLSKYDGLEIIIEKSDEKQYTFILKDELLPKSPNGREQSTVSWEYDFTVESENLASGAGKVTIEWNDLKPTYRGKKKKDVTPLDISKIKRFSIMMRSFFGDQEGDFSLSILSIAASKKSSGGVFNSGASIPEPYMDEPDQEKGTHAD